MMTPHPKVVLKLFLKYVSLACLNVVRAKLEKELYLSEKIMKYEQAVMEKQREVLDQSSRFCRSERTDQPF